MARYACGAGGQGNSVLDEVVKGLTLVLIFVRELGAGVVPAERQDLTIRIDLDRGDSLRSCVRE
ncbi:hypothetical protein GCM10027053_46670 [Intrasporangium mesophilum]